MALGSCCKARGFSVLHLIYKPTAVFLESWDPRGAGALTRKELGVLAAHVGLRHVVGVSAACRRSMNSVA